MIGCFLPRLFVIVLVFVAPIYGQIRDPSHRKVIRADSTLTRQWGVWNGHAGVADSPFGDPVKFRAEGQFPGVLAADFVYSAAVTFQDKTEAHLQFRISNEGRYGVAIGADGVRVYREARQANPYIDARGLSIAKMAEEADRFARVDLDTRSMRITPGVPHRLKVIASGPSLVFSLDGVDVVVLNDAAIGVGRFGLYVSGANNTASAVFSNVTADAMVTAASNFALLYNTLGYEAAGPKRALVRTLAELPETWVKDATFVVTPELEHRAVARGSLKETHVRSLGMSTWAADFDDVREPGRYVLKVTMEGYAPELSGRYFKHRLVSAPFEIGTNLITRRMLKPLALLNPEARRAADDDMAAHWTVHSGQFHATEDGIITAIGLHDVGGVLARTGDGYNGGAPSADTFTLSGDIAIDSGCDAQLQFQITDEERFGVTLQAGSAGGCVRGGAGAVSLHSEKPRTAENPNGTYNELRREKLPKAFKVGRFYRIVVNVAEGPPDGRNYADVDVDDIRMLSHVPVGESKGTFALKVWGATARFDHVIAWQPGLTFVNRGGVRIPVMNDGSKMTCEEGGRIVNGAPIVRPDHRKPLCYPLFAQRHGFHDCNNYIGEATSHGTFLAGLMDVWARRGEEFGPYERVMFHRAVVATAGYLDELQRTAGYTGEYAHEEPSRGARDGATWYYQVWSGLYGDAALAAKGATLDDPSLARKACIRASRAVTWLMAEESRAANKQATRFASAGSGPIQAWPDNLKALVYAQLAQCASREGDAVLPPLPIPLMKSEAIRIAHAWLELLSKNPEAQSRESHRSIPWLAGVDEVLRFGDDPELVAKLKTLASNLPKGEKEGFPILPAGTSAHWDNRGVVPDVREPLIPIQGTKPQLTWYIIPHFAMSAIDTSILVHYLTEDSDARSRAAGSLGWILGLNPGIPSTKALNAETGGRPWTAAAFVSNLNVPSARGMEAFMTPGTNIKDWLYSWEEGPRSVHREAWFVQPKKNGFMTLLNGHMLWDGEWDYWNQGTNGWMSGETFLLHDGAFLKAAIAFEDAMNDQWSPPHAALREPEWKVTEVTFFNTTLDQRNQTGWGFEEIEKTQFAHANRMSEELCSRFGFAGGHPTGHQDGERIGVLCVPQEGTRVVDANQQAIDGTGVSTFLNINTVPWFEASRVAAQLCAASVGGFFTGHQIGGLRGVVCVGSNSAKRFDTTAANVDMTWQDAARAATNFCLTKGYGGGFFDGESGVVCLRPGG